MYPRIRELREKHHLSQTALANIIHSGQRIYSDYERGRCNIPLGLLVALADYYDVSIDYMLGRTDNPKVNP